MNYSLSGPYCPEKPTMVRNGGDDAMSLLLHFMAMGILTSALFLCIPLVIK